MSQNPIHHRRSIRLKGYDYSQEGLYFITICVQNRECLFGDIVDGKIKLNDSGKLIEKQWLALPDRFHNVQLHEFVVMPDHFHAILEIVPSVGAYPCGRPLSDDDGRPKLNGVDGQPLNNAVESKSDDVSSFGHADTPIEINNNSLCGQPQGHAPTVAKRKTVCDMMDAFKSITTVEYIRGVKTMGWTPFNGKLWQRNYYEHIIRDYDAFVRISEYIRENPEKLGRK
ncbi:MAG: transposase [Paludibacter sp.]|nr:transposase [Paludibacter sp.]